MKRWTKITLIALAAAAIFGAIFYASMAEPYTRGRSLSFWLEAGATFDNPEEPEFTREETEAALREIGTRAIPFLLDRMRATDPRWKQPLDDLIRKQSHFSVEFKWAHDKQNEAAYGFSILGTNARSAGPELEKLFREASIPRFPACALGYLGTSSLPALHAAMTNDDVDIRYAAVHGITLLPLAPDQMAAELAPWYDDPQDMVAMHAFRNAMKVTPRAQKTAIVLRALESGRPIIQGGILLAIETIGIETNVIVPVLTRLLTNDTFKPRDYATNALLALDPAAAFAAGIDTNPPPLRISRRGRRGEPALNTTTNSTLAPAPANADASPNP
jgi:hypothetical protein